MGQAAFSRYIPPVYIDDIRNHLKGIKGYANGQKQVPGRHDLSAGQFSQKVRKKIKIFKISQKAQVKYQKQDQDGGTAPKALRP